MAVMSLVHEANQKVSDGEMGVLERGEAGSMDFVPEDFV
jgi:hypothetical protein